MEKSKKSYFKSLFKSADVFLAVFMGLVFACGLYYVDHHNLSSHISKAFVTYLLPMCKAGLVFTLVAMFGAIIFSTVKNKKVQVTDSLLIGSLSASIGGLISFSINKCSKFMILVWTCMLIVSVLVLAYKALTYHLYVDVDVEENKSSKNYFALFARKYNVFVVFAFAAILGITTLFNIKIETLFNADAVLYVVGAIAGLSCSTIIYTIVCGKKAKVNFLDLCLITLLIYVMFIGGLLIKTRAIRYDTLWAIAFGSLFLAVTARSLLASVNVQVEFEGKGPRNYYGLVFEKFGATVPFISGLLIGLLIDLCGEKGLRKTFERPMTSYFAILAIVLVALFGVLFIISLVKKGFVSKKANFIDLTLATGIVASSVSSLLLLQYQTIFRYHFVIVSLVVCVLLSFIRMRMVDVIKVEPIADDEIALNLKIVVDDAIHVYCNDKEIAAIANTNKKVEEIVVKKAEEVVVEEKVEEVAEKVVVEEESEDNTEEDSESEAEEILVPEEDKNRLNIAKRSFENKIKFTSDKTKNYYSILKNELLSYRAKSKTSRKSESFRRRGLIAKLSISGKSLRIHLALDPKAFDENKYHQIDLGERKAFRDVPFSMKIRSDLACRRAVELIQLVAQERSLRKNAKYEAVDFALGLDVDGVAILEKVGQLSLLKESVSKQEAESLTDDVLNFIPKIKMPKALNDEIVNVYIDTALKYVENTISEETLHAAQQIPASVSKINVKARNGLDKKITVICDEIDPMAAKAIILTGGKVFLIERN